MKCDDKERVGKDSFYREIHIFNIVKVAENG